MANKKNGSNYQGKREGKFDSSSTSRGTNPKYGSRNVTDGAKYAPKDMSRCKSNDISYYNKNAADFAAATNIPWAVIQGRPVDFGLYKADTDAVNGPEGNIALSNESMPGIMRVNFVHGPGWSDSKASPVNIAFAQIMGDLYAKTSAATLGFDQASLTQYVMCCSSIAANIAVALRAIGSHSFWITRNINYPRALLNSMGFDFESMKMYLPGLIVRLNNAIRQFNNMKVPNFMDHFERLFSLCYNVYIDEDSHYGQIYYFMPQNYYIYTTDDDGRALAVSRDLREVGVPDEAEVPAHLDSLLDVIDDQIGRLYQSQDFYLINGTISRAYKAVEFMSVPACDINTSINPTVDHVMQMQLMNATIIPVNVDSCSVGQTLDTTTQSFITIWKPKFDGVALNTVGYPTKGVILRYFGDEPSKEDNMEMTRLVNLVDINDASGIFITGSNPEIVTSISIYRCNEHNNAAKVVTINKTVYSSLGEDADIAALALQPFRYVPTIVWHDSAHAFTSFVGDVYNYVPFTKEQLELMNVTANYSLWKTKPVSGM